MQLTANNSFFFFKKGELLTVSCMGLFLIQELLELKADIKRQCEDVLEACYTEKSSEDNSFDLLI